MDRLQHYVFTHKVTLYCPILHQYVLEDVLYLLDVMAVFEFVETSEVSLHELVLVGQDLLQWAF